MCFQSLPRKIVVIKLRINCGFIGVNSVDIQNSKISKGLNAAKSSIQKLEGFGTIAVGDSVSQKKLEIGDKVVDICTYSM